MKDLVKTLKKEKYELIQKYEDQKQEFDDCKLDLKLLREQITRQRIGVKTNEGLVVQKPDSQQQNERETLIKEIECLKEKNLMLENDLKMIMCQKEEFEIERDSYKSKFKQLNKFLIENSSMGKQQTASKQVLSLNIDELISQNKYQSELNKSLKDEIKILNETLNKYKKLPQQKSSTDDNKALLKKSNDFLDLYSLNSYQTTNTSATSPTAFSSRLIKELNTVCEALLDSLNDKHIGLQHQRKCNKLLANRIQDLELEITSLKGTFDETKTLIKLDEDSDFSEDRLCNLINDLAEKFKLNDKDTKKEELEEDEIEDILSNYKKTSMDLFDVNSKTVNEPFILNT